MKAGFTFGGLLPRWLPQRGEYLDAWIATLHKDDPRFPTPPTRQEFGAFDGVSSKN